MSLPNISLHRTVWFKVVFAFVVPSFVLFSAFAIIVDYTAKRELESELGKRLTAVASAAATHVRAPLIAQLAPGMENNVQHEHCRRRLAAVAKTTQVTRIYVFDNQRRSYCDTESNVPIHLEYHKLGTDTHELSQVFATGEAQHSLLFEGVDGRPYKAGYAPVWMGKQIAYVVGVDAPATYFTQLASFRRTLIAYGIAIVGILLGIALLVAALFTRPIRKLAKAAGRIGQGDFRAPIPVRSGDEIGALAAVMEGMRANLAARDERSQMMVSGIAHEIRNPLAGIALFAGILRKDASPGHRDHIARIENEIAYLEAVVGQFLDYAKRDRAEPTKVAVADIVDDVVTLCLPESKTMGVTLLKDQIDGTVLAEPTILKRILLNLIQNAMQATADDKNPTVRLSARQHKDTVAIEIWNCGPVIPDEVREKMFQPFFTTKQKGTGLGLAFVKEALVDYGGKIEVERRDNGTMFCVFLPSSDS